MSAVLVYLAITNFVRSCRASHSMNNRCHCETYDGTIEDGTRLIEPITIVDNICIVRLHYLSSKGISFYLILEYFISSRTALGSLSIVQ